MRVAGEMKKTGIAGSFETWRKPTSPGNRDSCESATEKVRSEKAVELMKVCSARSLWAGTKRSETALLA